MLDWRNNILPVNIETLVEVTINKNPKNISQRKSTRIYKSKERNKLKKNDFDHIEKGAIIDGKRNPKIYALIHGSSFKMRFRMAIDWRPPIIAPPTGNVNIRPILIIGYGIAYFILYSKDEKLKTQK